MTDNLAAQTGRTLPEWFPILAATGLEKHGDLMAALKNDHGVSHGFANTIVLAYRSQGTSQDGDDLVDAQYQGAKAALRPIYEALAAGVRRFGADVDIVPKKTGVSLRRSKQFAVVEAVSAKRVQVGIQLPGEPTTDRLVVGNEMCTHRVNLTSLGEVDDEFVGWLREAYSRA